MAGELEWGWLFTGAIFVLMGGGPLLLALKGVAEVASGGRSHAGGRVVVGPRRPNVLSSTGEHPDPAATSGGDLTARLERLARLRASGALTEAEFEAAKGATFDEAGA